jgi:hypothetical protein
MLHTMAFSQTHSHARSEEAASDSRAGDVNTWRRLGLSAVILRTWTDAHDPKECGRPSFQYLGRVLVPEAVYVKVLIGIRGGGSLPLLRSRQLLLLQHRNAPLLPSSSIPVNWLPLASISYDPQPTLEHDFAGSWGAGPSSTRHRVLDPPSTISQAMKERLGDRGCADPLRRLPG